MLALNDGCRRLVRDSELSRKASVGLTTSGVSVTQRAHELEGQLRLRTRGTTFPPPALRVVSGRCGDVLPRVTLRNVVDAGPSNTKLGGERFAGFASGNTNENYSNSRGGEFGGCAPLEVHVEHVVAVAPNEHVIGSNACGRVAVVAEGVRVGQLAPTQYPCGAVSKPIPARGDVKASIPVRINAGRPQPARRGIVNSRNFGPESFFDRRVNASAPVAASFV